MARAEKHFLQLMSETKLFQPLAGLVALLQKATAAGIRLCLVTDSPRDRVVSWLG